MKIDVIRNNTMENSQALDDNFTMGLSITQDIRDFLHETAKWAHFLSILGFIMVGFFIIIAIFAGTFIGMVMSEMQNEIPGFSNSFFSIFYLIIAAINIIPIFYLFRFATNTKKALRSDNQIILSEAFENLKSHYKFIGILAALFIGFYVLVIISSIFAAVII